MRNAAQEQDLLFCKIAISTGLVSEEQAQKCLAFCERRQREGGRRPMVGAILSKYKILRAEEVQRVYSAVSKRLGTSNSVAHLSSGSGGRSARGTASRRRGGRSRTRAPGGRIHGGTAAAARRVDPNTLWMGIGFGVVFIGVIVAILVVLIYSSGTPPGDGRGEEMAQSTPAATEKKPSSVTPTPGSPGAVAGSPGLAALNTPPPVDEEFLTQHNTTLNNARRYGYAYDSPGRGYKLLKAFYEQNKHFYATYAELREVAETELERLKEKASGDRDVPEEEALNGDVDDS
ncbi:MAG: hypothetical protein O7J95_20050 [Planctomycetota bacterium]|nr:hypothetical protein [Planctomycetota bacterium]